VSVVSSIGPTSVSDARTTSVERPLDHRRHMRKLPHFRLRVRL